MSITCYCHARRDTAAPRVLAKPATGPYDNPYYVLHIGADLVVFLEDDQCRAIMDALGSRPPLPKTDEQVDAEREEARGELPPYQHQDRNTAVAEPFRSIISAVSAGCEAGCAIPAPAMGDEEVLRGGR